MRRLGAVLIGALLMLGIGATPANAAPTGPTFYLTADATLAPYAGTVAGMWTKATNVTVIVTGSCAGPRCIHAVVDDASGYLGLTTRTTDGSYLATVGSFACQYGYNGTVDTMAHEVGHGIINGLGGGYWHATDARDLMSASHYPGDPVRRITRETKTYLAPLS